MSYNKRSIYKEQNIMNKMIVNVNNKAVKEVYKTQKMMVSFYLVVGILMLGGFIVSTILNTNWVRIISIVGIVAASVIIGFSLFILISLIMVTSSTKTVERRNEITFNLDHMFFETYDKEEKIEEAKIKYEELEKYVITKNYIYSVLKVGKGLIIFNRDDKLISLFNDKKIPRKKM